MNMLALWPSNRGFAMCWAPIVLNAFTTLAPAAHRAISSPADVVCPSASPERSGFRGLVASTTTFPLRSPAPLIASWADPQGTARTTISAAATAFRTLAACALPPESFSSSSSFRSWGSRTPKTTSCPRAAHAFPSVPPTLPAPMIAIFIPRSSSAAVHGHWMRACRSSARPVRRALASAAVYAQFLVAACQRLADPRHLVAIRHDVGPAEPARRSKLGPRWDLHAGAVDHRHRVLGPPGQGRWPVRVRAPRRPAGARADLRERRPHASASGEVSRRGGTPAGEDGLQPDEDAVRERAHGGGVGRARARRARGRRT